MFRKERLFFLVFFNVFLVAAFSVFLYSAEKRWHENTEETRVQTQRQSAFAASESYFRDITEMMGKLSKSYSESCPQDFIYSMRQELFTIQGGIEFGVVDKKGDHAIITCDSWGNKVVQKVDMPLPFEGFVIIGPFDIKSLSEPVFIIKKSIGPQEYNLVIKESIIKGLLPEDSLLTLSIFNSVHPASTFYNSSKFIKNLSYISLPNRSDKEINYYVIPTIILFFIICLFLLTPKLVHWFETKDLKRKINRNFFYNVYQPIVNVETKKLFSIEVFLRSKSSQGAGEIAKIIKDFDLYIEHTLFQIAEVETSFTEHFIRENNFQINVSSKHIESEDFIQQITELSEAMRNSLILEITEDENLMKHKNKIKQNMEILRNAGCRFAIDDFGMEYSGLSYVSEFDFEIIKTDKIFMGDSPKNNAIMKSIQTLSQELNIACIAEGVESEENVLHLTEMGVVLHQGWYHNKAMSAHDVLKYKLAYENAE